MKRGEVWWASLEEPKGSEPGYRRPVVIVSANAFNRSRIQTVIAAIVTSNLRLSEAPGNFRLPRSGAGLDHDSVVNVSQLITLDRSFLTEPCGNLNKRQVESLNDGLKLVLEI